ncbi:MULTISPECIES: NAD(P)-dependent alcohol dehydrogenase [unclassified Erythrobacter]|uniref:zinc-dependent alcohol dehydrogenase family protein n=1 Tax=unclassified Erythrobacter TaxID=2633097 RepID=UPI00076C22CC|nr:MULTISPECIES: NAD(P)-dependent alcohol dehydrogenase [unclassified Erythrobacter]KWV96203.1 NADPH:quinone oxidoreductase [Erythrobacter sp. AP23]MBO6526254.1 NAD(P)-dependent alcohol dehydrogenase [Erythrobacter sp.]MBO6530507.1 NAD(P)-dependent alcohol dehydrogenase [Erythrobacter sp.]
MKAIRTGASPSTLEALDYCEIDDAPAPGPGEVTVGLKASSLNYHDYAVVKGMIPTQQGRIPMSDGAGEVTAIGEGVTEFAVGDHVVSTFFPDWLDGEPPATAFTRVPGDGIDGYAREAITAPTHWFTRAPEGFSHAEAATLTCAGLTAWRALFVDYSLKPGDTVLVQGTGGVSIFALQFAKAAGATVIATSSSDEKLERVRKLGADHLINYKEVQAWGPKALEITGGRGVDCVVEIGGAGTLDQSMLATRVGGHIALIGVLAGFAGPVQTALLFSKNLKVQGLTVGSRTMQQEMIAAIDANGIKPQISDSFALKNLADAFRHQESGSHFGKIAVEI